MAAARAMRGITRREGLIALALAGPAALLAACTSDTAEPGPTPSPTTSPEGAAESVAADEALLVASYDAALAALPDADPAVIALLTGIRDQHAAHRDALGGTSLVPDAPPQPAAQAAVIDELLAAERQAARDRIDACETAADPELARLLAMIGASEASHVPALREVR
jgi:hypothetical protein